MPDDFFRVRLICVLLNTVGMCFDHGRQVRKLDNFLVFFQVMTYTSWFYCVLDIISLVLCALQGGTTHGGGLHVVGLTRGGPLIYAAY